MGGLDKTNRPCSPGNTSTCVHEMIAQRWGRWTSRNDTLPIQPFLSASIAAPEACTNGDRYMTGRTFFAMLMFAGMIGAVMWFFVLPALTVYRPAIP